MKYLRSKEKKQFCNAIEKQWGDCPEEIKEGVLIRTGKERIYIVNKDIERIDFEKIKISHQGVYIAEDKNELRLSMEGSQIVGPNATKNVLNLNKAQREQWFRGQDIELEGSSEGYLIVKYEEDYMGSAKHKENVLMNFVPKNRRLLETHES